MADRPRRDRHKPRHEPISVAYRATSNVLPEGGTSVTSGPEPAVSTRKPKSRAKTASAPPKPKAVPKEPKGVSKKNNSKGKTAPKTTTTGKRAGKTQKQSDSLAQFFSTDEDPDHPVPILDLGMDGSLPINVDASEPSNSRTKPTAKSKKRRAHIVSDDESSDNEGGNHSELYVDVPTAAGDISIKVAASSSYATILHDIYTTIGCTEVKTKPTLCAQTGASPKKQDRRLALCSDDTWKVVVQDAVDNWQQQEGSGGARVHPKIKICLEDDYLQNLKHTRDMAKANGAGNGLKKKKKAPVDLNATTAEEAAPSAYDLNDRQRKASTAVNLEYKACKTGRCSGPCVRIDDNLCTPVSQAMLSTLIDAIANGVDGVTVTNPPQLPMFDIWPGRSKASTHSTDTPERRPRRLSDRFSPYRSSRHGYHRERSPAHRRRSSPQAPSTHLPRIPTPIIALNSTGFASLTDPSIPDFFIALHETAAYSRRNLDQLIPLFETRDFYTISSIAHFNDLELMKRVPEISPGNASFVLAAIAQYFRSIPS